MSLSISNVVVKSATGTDKALSDYAGKVLLIVNVASRCGFTKQYAGLQALNEAYAAKGLAVLGFPCLLYTSPSPRDLSTSRMPSSA